MKSFLKSLKEIGKDCIIPFKNFVHWNITKALNSIMGYLVGCLLSAPFVLICFFYVLFLFPEISIQTIFSKIITFSLSPSDFDGLFDKSGLTTILSFLFFLITLLFYFGISYSYVLNLVMYKNYFAGEKLPYKKNIFLHFPTIKKYAQIFLWNTLFLSIPFLVFGAVFIVFLLSAGGMEGALNIVLSADGRPTLFSVGLLITFIVCVISFAYINFRTIFSVLLFVNSNEFGHHQETKALDYLKKSVKITSGIKKIFIFLFIFILYGIVTLPYTYKMEVVADNISKGNRYVQLVQYASMSGVTLPETLEDELVTLSEEFQGKSGQDIIDSINSNSTQQMVLLIFEFLVLKGLTELLMFSYFSHILLQKKTTHD